MLKLTGGDLIIGACSDVSSYEPVSEKGEGVLAVQFFIIFSFLRH